MDCGLGLKQNTTKLGVYWPDTDFKKKALGPLTPRMLRTQSVQLRVRTSTGLEKVRLSRDLSQNNILLHEFNTRGNGKIVVGGERKHFRHKLQLFVYI